MRQEENGVEDSLLFLAALEEIHGNAPATRPVPGIAKLVTYALGGLSEKEEAELHDQAAFDEALGSRMFDVWQIVSSLAEHRSLDVSPVTNPFLAEIYRAWESQSKTVQTQTPKQQIETIGRDEDVLALRHLLDSGDRFVAVSGPGGIGKTCLLKKFGQDFIPGFEGSVFLLECGNLDDSHDFYAALARIFELESTQSPAEAIRTHLQGRHVLLLLDGLDNHLELEAEIGDLLSSLPRLCVIASSRSAPQTAREYSLAPLNLADEGSLFSEAVRLFAQMAKRAIKDFQVNASNIKLVRELCQISMGVPLSMSIVAGCLPDQSLDELVKNLKSPTFSPLEYASQAVHASITHSFLLLSSQDKTILGQLGVFAGSFSYEDALNVCGLQDAPFSNSLAHLQRCGLVESNFTRDGILYRMHDSVREYLQNSPDYESTLASTIDRYLQICVAHAEQVGRLMEGGLWGEGIQELLWLNSDFRKAMRLVLEMRDEARIVQLADGLARTYFEAGFLSDFEFLTTATDSIEDKELKVRMLGLQGALASLRGDEKLCAELWNRRLALCRELRNVVDAADTLNDLAWQAFDLGQKEVADAYLLESESLATEALAWEILASSYIIRARMLASSEDMEGCRKWVGQVVGLLPNCTDKILLPFVYQGLAVTYVALGEQSQAIVAFRHLLKLASEGHRSIHVARTLIRLAPLYEDKGEIETSLLCLVSATKVLNEYDTKDRKLTEQDLEAFCERHGARVKFARQEAEDTPWQTMVQVVLEN